MPYLNRPVLPAGTLSRTPQPTIPTGDGLLLRPWRAEDAPAVHAAFQDPVMHQWHIRAADSEEEVRGWIAEWQQAWDRESNVQWAVADAADDRLLGRVALRQVLLGDGVAEVAYWTTAGARGRGVAARATRTLARWALDEIGFQRLELSHAVANEASCRVAQKAGFALEGTKRSALLHPDGWHDMHLHARVRGD
ncbi:GNAT family N-acetyltransferase [Streptomyces sp. G3]|uniref:GNAT family N-acetyltransferase n=1 Tax=Streptomyces TaxID=1883 RepID=UPI0013DED7D9|nr:MULTISPECIES: GNAT family N-acetyltransferase [Streptomyces]MBH5134259.1 GNAT family N-acetyltransferase [Streptomyces sp. HB-N217]MCM1938624.1 GNAT family N-acetyltransferase [Streptomyces sp. G3]MCQ4203772.1 GNAT family N-acetyltransferase [Streptomyces coelicoflavus]QUW90326.1 Putative ribosomal N-acetyltransferase YdaF [Streptomyces sp. V17-9]WKX21977.1 GNAT family N-acetyltransferase [Streptomyces sp. HUAS CX7]